MKKTLLICLTVVLMLFVVSCSDTRKNAVIVCNETSDNVLFCFAVDTEIIDFNIKPKEHIVVDWDKVGTMKYMYIAKSKEGKDCIDLNYKIEHTGLGLILISRE